MNLASEGERSEKKRFVIEFHMVGGPCYEQPQARETLFSPPALKYSLGFEEQLEQCDKFCGRERNSRTTSFAFTSQHASSGQIKPQLAHSSFPFTTYVGIGFGELKH
ncbi:hypothetical protein VNO80_22004 [Phaseolus coccineus]|uniref:Uncharacterized protein n=1 Tax=Phaseolus coccineus TaxID=3886 RepID=A0AAN9M4A3_PHACN